MLTDKERITELEEQMEIVTGVLVAIVQAVKALGGDFSETDLTDDE